MYSRRALLMAGGALALAACSPRGQMALVPEPAEGTTVHRVFLGTNRPLDAGNFPTRGRTEDLRLAHFDVSIPPNRPIGQIQWPEDPPDAATQFVTRSAVLYGEEDRFVANLRRALAANPAYEGTVIVFVHGFNTNTAEAVYRWAQMSHDLNLRGQAVAFSWPSQERSTAYVADRDSALFSRADLERLLRLIQRANPSRVVLMAHSMGCLLALETMVQIERDRPGSVPALIDSVVMIAPDIDVDLSQRLLRKISRLPDPFIVFTSREDRALRLSRQLGGRHPRLGMDPDVSRFEDVSVVFLDVTAFNDRSAGDFGHLTVGTSPALIDLIPQLREAARHVNFDVASNPGLLPGTVLSVRRATEVVLLPGGP